MRSDTLTQLGFGLSGLLFLGASISALLALSAARLAETDEPAKSGLSAIAENLNWLAIMTAVCWISGALLNLPKWAAAQPPRGTTAGSTLQQRAGLAD